MEAHYTIWFIFIFFLKVKGKLDWTIQNKISVYGQDLTLICKVPHCCSKEAGWEAWTQKLRTIFIDIRDLTFTRNSKYTGDVYNFGYSLVIRNVSMEDVDIMYSCVYGDERSYKKMLIEKDIFLLQKQDASGNKTDETTLKETQQSTRSNIRNNEINTGLVTGLICAGLLIVVAVIIAAVYLKKRLSNQRTLTQKRNVSREGEEGKTLMHEGEGEEGKTLMHEGKSEERKQLMHEGTVSQKIENCQFNNGPYSGSIQISGGVVINPKPTKDQFRNLSQSTLRLENETVQESKLASTEEEHDISDKEDTYLSSQQIEVQVEPKKCAQAVEIQEPAECPKHSECTLMEEEEEINQFEDKRALADSYKEFEKHAKPKGINNILHILKKKELSDVELENIEERIGLPDGKERDICNN